MEFNLSKDIGIALKVGGGFFPLSKGVRKIRKISDPYTISTFFVGNDFAKTEVVGVRRFLRVNGTEIHDDVANTFICGLYGKTGSACETEAVLFDRKNLTDGICDGIHVPVVVVMKNFSADAAPEDGCISEFECDIYINGAGTEGQFEITEV